MTLLNESEQQQLIAILSNDELDVDQLEEMLEVVQIGWDNEKREEASMLLLGGVPGYNPENIVVKDQSENP